MISREILDLEKGAIEKYIKAISGKKDDISLILISHLYVEYWIEVFIRYSLRKPEKILDSVDLSFFEKVALAESLGFDRNDEFGLADAIKKLNAIRNRIAHNLEYRLSKNDLRLLSTLKFESGKEQQKLIEEIGFPREELMSFCIALQGYVVGFIEAKINNKGAVK